MRCFYCENLDCEYAVLDKTEERHLFKVLRASAGTEIMLMDGKGNTAEAVIDERKRIKVNKTISFEEPKRKVHLFVAIPKKNKMDMLLAQCTEAGVWAIHPIISERNVAVPKKDNAEEKWKDKLIEACKQSHNPFVPEIFSSVKFSDAVNFALDNNYTAFYGSTANVQDSLRDYIDNMDVAWFVGPEGGFTENEILVMENSGFIGISLGRCIMRVETAAVVGVSVLGRE